MSVFFSGTTGTSKQNGYVNWGDLAAAQNLTKFTVAAWINPNSDNDWNNGTGQEIVCKYATGPNKGWILARSLPTKYFYFGAVGWSTTIGQWSTPNNSLLANNKYHVAVVYDASLTTNSPTMYINAASQSLTPGLSPAGTWSTNTGTNLVVGITDSQSSGASSMPGRIEDVRIYNRLLSANEIVLLYGGGAPARTVLENYDNGLVWHAPLMYATNKGSSLPFSGSLSGSNLFYNRIAGAVGTPTAASATYPSGGYDFAFGTGF